MSSPCARRMLGVRIAVDRVKTLRADGRRNRERIVAAAVKLVARDGAQASLEEIARRAGVGSATLHRHFPSRGALLEAVFRDGGIDLDRPMVATCGSGVTAAVIAFAAHMLGREVPIYDGSWAEWGADPATPKARGA